MLSLDNWLNEDLDYLATQQARAADHRRTFRRLAASTLLSAISDLSSVQEQIRFEAVMFLKNEGTLLIRDLGMSTDLLDDLIETPPKPGTLKASNARGKRAKTLGKRERRLGRQHQSAPGVII
jgi:hypothetical protein